MDKETSLGKALRLLMAVGESADGTGVTVAELVGSTGLSRPTVYRYLGELQDYGMVKTSPRQPIWQLGPKVIALAAMAGNWVSLRRRAREGMENFVREVGFTVHLGIRDGNEVVYVDKAESPQHMTISSVIGQRRALNVTALGKCLVAFDANPNFAKLVAKEGLAGRTPNSITTEEAWLREIGKVHTAGFAFDMEECDPGARCVAAPIFDAQGYAVAAVSVSALLATPGGVDLDSLADQVRSLADLIGVRGGPPTAIA